MGGVNGGVRVVGARVDPDETATVFATGERLRFHVVQTRAKVVVAQTIVDVEAEALGFVIGARDVDGSRSPATCVVGSRNAWCARGGRRRGARARRVVAPGRLAVIDLLRTVQGRDGQVVSQVAGVLADVQTCLVFVVGACVLDVARGSGGVVVGVAIAVVLGDVGYTGQLKEMVVGDVPVDLRSPAGYSYSYSCHALVVVAAACDVEATPSPCRLVSSTFA